MCPKGKGAILRCLKMSGDFLPKAGFFLGGGGRGGGVGEGEVADPRGYLSNEQKPVERKSKGRKGKKGVDSQTTIWA